MDFTVKLKNRFDKDDTFDITDFELIHEECEHGEISHRLYESNAGWELLCKRCLTKKNVKLDEDQRVNLIRAAVDSGRIELKVHDRYKYAQKGRIFFVA